MMKKCTLFTKSFKRYLSDESSSKMLRFRVFRMSNQELEVIVKFLKFSIGINLFFSVKELILINSELQLLIVRKNYQLGANYWVAEMLFTELNSRILILL